MIAVLGGLADVEPDLMRTRTAEGRSRAKAPRAPDGPTPGTHTAKLHGLALGISSGVSLGD
jgi:hypothetical protein